jgi:EAL domain-containing protein (putative c-di-GMP-specific phosphodiesterase class I)
MSRDDNDAVIVRSTIDLAHNLGRDVTAEGIENFDTWNLLQMLGCDTAQGYYICRPVPGAELLRWLDACGGRFLPE